MSGARAERSTPRPTVTIGVSIERLERVLWFPATVTVTLEEPPRWYVANLRGRAVALYRPSSITLN